MVFRARRSAVFVLSTLACGAALAAGADRPAVLFGFTAADSATQQTLEQRFDAALNPADLDAWLKNMASEANHVGAPHDKANAEFTRDQFQQWGWDAKIEVFYPLYPTLKSHTLEMVAPSKFVAKLKEPSVEGDATSTRTDGMGPYNVYGADGDVTGELVYVNFGMPDDYKDLARRGIDVNGKIAIARYGVGWRDSSPSWRRCMALSAVSFTPTPNRMATAPATCGPKGAGGRPTACSVAL